MSTPDFKHAPNLAYEPGQQEQMQGLSLEGGWCPATVKPAGLFGAGAREATLSAMPRRTPLQVIRGGVSYVAMMFGRRSGHGPTHLPRNDCD